MVQCVPHELLACFHSVDTAYAHNVFAKCRMHHGDETESKKSGFSIASLSDHGAHAGSHTTIS